MRPSACADTDGGMHLYYATVTGCVEQWFFLSAAATLPMQRVRRADGCLLEPACGDSVLVCGGVGAPSYILAVLARANDASAVLRLPGGAAISADAGTLSLSAERLELAAREGLALQSPRFTLAALRGEVVFHTLSANINLLDTRVGKLMLLAQSVHSVVGRLVQKAKNSFRTIENLDQTQAGRVRLQVAERYSVSAKHASVIADGQVKIDGEKIDLG